MLEKEFYFSVFNIIEHLTKSELTTSSRRLIIAYILDSKEDNNSKKARVSIRRYTSEDIPLLEDIRKKSQIQELSALDHLVLKMEYAAKRLDENEQ